MNILKLGGKERLNGSIMPKLLVFNGFQNNLFSAKPYDI